MRVAIFAVTAAALILAGCTSDPTEDLAGCFSFSGPTDRPTIQITEEDGTYALSSRAEGLWSAAKPLVAPDSKLIQQVFGTDADKIQASLGLADGSVTIYKVEPGKKIAGGTADSGFLASFFFGTGQIYKTQACDS